jgi:hypothetical protein
MAMLEQAIVAGTFVSKMKNENTPTPDRASRVSTMQSVLNLLSQEDRETIDMVVKRLRITRAEFLAVATADTAAAVRDDPENQLAYIAKEANKYPS